MGFLIHLLNAAEGDMGVLLRGGEAAMAQQFLNEAQIGPVFEQMGGAGMAQGVGSGFPQPQGQAYRRRRS